MVQILVVQLGVELALELGVAVSSGSTIRAAGNNVGWLRELDVAERL
jgi:hypothetical protein